MSLFFQQIEGAAADTARAAAESLGAATPHGAAPAGGGVDFGELLHHVQDAGEIDTPFGMLWLCTNVQQLGGHAPLGVAMPRLDHCQIEISDGWISMR